MSLPIDKFLKSHPSKRKPGGKIEPYCEESDIHTYLRIHDSNLEEPIKDALYRARRSYIRKNNRYFFFVSSVNRLEFVADSRMSSEMINYYKDCSTYLSYNSCFSYVDNRIMLRTDEYCSNVSKRGPLVIPNLFIEIDYNIVVFMPDLKNLYKNDAINQLKTVGHLTLKNDSNNNVTWIKSRSAGEHSIAIMNSQYLNCDINYISENDRFYALTFAQLFSFPFSTWKEGNLNIVKIHINPDMLVGANEYPFNKLAMLHEDIKAILSNFNSRLSAQLLLNSPTKLQDSIKKTYKTWEDIEVTSKKAQDIQKTIGSVKASSNSSNSKWSDIVDDNQDEFPDLNLQETTKSIKKTELSVSTTINESRSKGKVVRFELQDKSSLSSGDTRVNTTKGNKDEELSTKAGISTTEAFSRQIRILYPRKNQNGFQKKNKKFILSTNTSEQKDVEDKYSVDSIKNKKYSNYIKSEIQDSSHSESDELISSEGSMNVNIKKSKKLIGPINLTELSDKDPNCINNQSQKKESSIKRFKFKLMNSNDSELRCNNDLKDSKNQSSKLDQSSCIDSNFYNETQSPTKKKFAKLKLF